MTSLETPASLPMRVLWHTLTFLLREAIWLVTWPGAVHGSLPSALAAEEPDKTAEVYTQPALALFTGALMNCAPSTAIQSENCRSLRTCFAIRGAGFQFFQPWLQCSFLRSQASSGHCEAEAGSSQASGLPIQEPTSLMESCGTDITGMCSSCVPRRACLHRSCAPKITS